MPLPFILAGAAIAAGAFGIKKGLDAKSDMDKAKRVTESANEIGRKAQARLENQQEDTKAAVEGLGRTKIEILSGSVNDFINNFKKIKNINLRETEGIKELKHLNMSQDDFSDLGSVFVPSFKGGSQWFVQCRSRCSDGLWHL